MSGQLICLLTGLACPFIGSLAIPVLGRFAKADPGRSALFFSALSLASFVLLCSRLELPVSLVFSLPWIPSLKVDLSFLVDGWSLFFAFIVSGMGCLVVVYANAYLESGLRHTSRFFSYLMLFMGSMLGTVLSNNFLLLFVFWELTGLASFLLIGFLHGESKSRIGARQALLVTGTTGLVLLVGLVMVYSVTGTYDYRSWVESGLPIDSHRIWLWTAFGLMMIGAFGKSAQLPFHFWLPNAMAAPTPVSAYLHSATMVKLGVFLSGRLFPLFGGEEAWSALVLWIPFTTLVLGAVFALLSHDLKAILAYSTISQLGFLIGYHGLNSLHGGGLPYGYLHILNHVFYKGALFMIVGVVIHCTHIKDIRRLGGLGRRMPLLAFLTLVAGACMAGIPGTLGFISKEMMLKETFQYAEMGGWTASYPMLCVMAGSILKVAFSIRLFFSLFIGKNPECPHDTYPAPGLLIQAPAAVLVAGILLLGMFPGLLDPVFKALAVDRLSAPAPLSLWHGFSRELWASLSVVLLGAILHQVGWRTQWRAFNIPSFLELDRRFEFGLEAFSTFSKDWTRFLKADSPVHYLPIIIGFFVVLVGGSMVWNISIHGTGRSPWPGAGLWDANFLRVFAATLIALSVVGVLVLKRWTSQLISLSIAGFLICFYFVLYRAPDLALTQILVEVVTLFMIVILLGRFPRSAEEGEINDKEPVRVKALHLLISVCVGIMATTWVLWFGADTGADRLGPSILENTFVLAEGKNAVNTILVDFRGFDTMGEVIVLISATLGCLGLLMRYKRTADEYRQGAMGPPGFGTEERQGEGGEA